MTPVDMICKHDPENGSWGDCMRACVASLLDLPAEEVPHFAHGDPGAEIVLSELTGFLRRRGMYPLAMWVRPGADTAWFDCLRGNYMLCGVSERGTEHCVVATGRHILVHDPFPDFARKAMVRPIEEASGAFYCVYLFVSLNDRARVQELAG